MLRTLPGDDVRQIMWRFADRYDLQMLVQSVARRGARAGRAAGRGRGPQYPRVDGGEGRAPEGVRRVGHHRGLPGPGVRRLHRGSQEPGARARGVRAGLGRCRRGDRQPRGAPRARADPRTRHAEQRAIYMARRAVEPARRAALARRVLPDRTAAVRRCRDRPAERQGAGRRMGRTARSRSCRSTSAAASSRTWASPTS